MALDELSVEYHQLYALQKAVSVAEPEMLDTNNDPLLVNSRYWVVNGGGDDVLIYNDRNDIDNYLENFKDSGYDDFDNAKKALHKYCPEAALVVYCGHNRFKGVSAWMQ
ncbi:hypothetical protein [Levilactobacillus andaensis]|uniref:hypothetical protein n=1 Tax=Levilactobacillus andaensis TaxID=2799570 RepID=UPI0019433890|nr:hypothetical protein [Levilactobacillus andaensis]